MKLSICTDVMGNLSFTDMLDKCVSLGVEGIEMTGGGWSKGPHFRADELLADKGLLKQKLAEIAARRLKIAALNCPANPLDPSAMGKRHLKELKETLTLADEPGLEAVIRQPLLAVRHGVAACGAAATRGAAAEFSARP